MTYIVWYVLMLVLLGSVFHRSVKSDIRTRLDVRMVLATEGAAPLIGIGAPFYGWQPDFVVITMVAVITVAQVVFAYHWNSGIPKVFMEPKFLPKRRSGDPAW